MIALVFDLETDGLINNTAIRQEKWPRVIEFCGKAVNLGTGELVDEYTTLIDPNRNVSSVITKITGIKNEMLRGQHLFPRHIDRIKGLISSSDCVIAHNATFDKTVLDLECKRNEIEAIKWTDVKCTVELTEHYKGHRMKLADLHEHLFGEGITGAHRAEADVNALIRICRKLFENGEL